MKPIIWIAAFLMCLNSAFADISLCTQLRLKTDDLQILTKLGCRGNDNFHVVVPPIEPERNQEALRNQLRQEMRRQYNPAVEHTHHDAYREQVSRNYVFKTKSYVGNSEWNFPTSYDVEFASLGGVRMDAIEKAMQFCLEENERCVLKATSQIHNKAETREGNAEKRRYVKFEAIVQSIDHLPLELFERGKVYREEDSINQKRNRHGTLNHLGTKVGALDGALIKCYKDGNDLCTYIEVVLTESNNYRDGKYYISAKASVRGYKLAREEQ